MSKDSPFPDESLSIDTVEYLNYVRSLPCIVNQTAYGNEGINPCGASDPHHLLAVGTGRNRKTPRWEDYKAIPLCREHHAELHQIGIIKFENEWAVMLFKESLIILARWIFHKSKLQKENNGKRD